MDWNSAAIDLRKFSIPEVGIEPLRGSSSNRSSRQWLFLSMSDLRSRILLSRRKSWFSLALVGLVGLSNPCTCAMSWGVSSSAMGSSVGDGSGLGSPSCSLSLGDWLLFRWSSDVLLELEDFAFFFPRDFSCFFETVGGIF